MTENMIGGCAKPEGANMYAKDTFIADGMTVFRETDGNRVDVPGAGTITLFDAPLIGFADAGDPLFERFKQPEIIGENYFTPAEWLPTAKTVVSFFLPFTDRVRSSNKVDKTDPSAEWLYARIEGQAFIGRFADGLKRLLRGKTIEACVPGLDERFDVRYEMTTAQGIPDFHADSRWSERHAAYVCGLGTFGLSRGLITEKGMAGRYASVIVSEKWQPTPRPYTGIDDYCVRCGACARNCPAHAISLDGGKNNVLCRAYVEKQKEKYSPRYGCGKCQVGVPCEFKAPGKR